MRLDDLRAFTAVVEHGGFRAAAAALYCSQPTVSRQVARLEASLGVTLLRRGPGGAVLTAHGRTLRDGAPRLLQGVEDLRTATAGSWGETIRLGTAATAAGSYLAPFLSHWIPWHPELHIDMIEDGAVRLRSRLENRECDVAIVAAPLPDSFDSLPITTVSVQAWLADGHELLTAGRDLTVADLDGRRLLVSGRTFLSTELLQSACRLAGVEPHVAYECSNAHTLMALAEAGAGIAVIGDSVDVRGFTDLPTRPVRNTDGRPLSFELRVAWLRERTLSATVATFVQELSDYTRSFRTAGGVGPVH